MANLWIRVEHVTPDKPEVHSMADTLGLDPDCVTGKLVRLWIWADQQTVGGNAFRVTKTLLDRITMCAGFAEAMIDVGWLHDEDGTLVFPNFERLNGEGAKRRGLTSQRVAKSRSKSNQNVTQNVLQKAHNSVTREEKRREDINTPPTPPRRGEGDDASCSKEDEKREWAKLGNELREELQVVEAGSAIDRARRRGCLPYEVAAVIAHFRSHPDVWTTGHLVKRIQNMFPGCNATRGWPDVPKAPRGSIAPDEVSPPVAAAEVRLSEMADDARMSLARAVLGVGTVAYVDYQKLGRKSPHRWRIAKTLAEELTEETCSQTT